MLGPSSMLPTFLLSPFSTPFTLLRPHLGFLQPGGALSLQKQMEHANQQTGFSDSSSLRPMHPQALHPAPGLLASPQLPVQMQAAGKVSVVIKLLRIPALQGNSIGWDRRPPPCFPFPSLGWLSGVE